MVSLLTTFSLLVSSCKEKSSAPANHEIEQWSANDIMQKAHQRAGGKIWQNPESLTLIGRGIFYRGSDTSFHESHKMWRVYESSKEEAHSANGKVRIESIKEGKPVFIVSYDGQNTYDLSGKQEKSAADKRWASNFGFGVIRHAFDEGYTLEKAGEGIIKSRKTYRIKVIDKVEGETIFDIDQENFDILGVAFDTPRGWHERHYSNFFTKDEYSWRQSGLVELFYEGKKANDIIWEDFDINQKLPDSLFIL